MIINEFTSSLYDEMEMELKDVQSAKTNTVQSYRDILSTILKYIARLKRFISEHKFTDNDEEINFFKNIKTKFFSKLIYFQKVLEIESRLPLGSINDIKDYYQKELHKINDYFSANNEFLIYYRSNANSLDHLYFIRQEPDSWLLLNFDNYETDLNFTTIYDHKLSKTIAYERLSLYLNEASNRLEPRLDKFNDHTSTGEQKILWTGSKVSLVELLYALQSTGSFNNGTLDIKQLATYFEKQFNIDLGNYYRVFQEIRIRKMSRTTFLDQLKERLISRMDESDLNPKFK